MQDLKNIISELKEGQSEQVFSFDDRVLTALARQPAVVWCAENAAALRPELKEALACIYRQAEYRGGRDVGTRARLAFLRVLPGHEKVFDEARPLDFKLKHLVERGLPDSHPPDDTKGAVSPYLTAVRNALGQLFPDGCRPSLGTAVNLLRAVPDLLDGELRLNEMTGEVVVGDRELVDADISTFRTNIERRFTSVKGEPLAIHKDAAWDAVTSVAPGRKYHPVRDYLNALHWDGEARLARCAAELLNSEPNSPLLGVVGGLGAGEGGHGGAGVGLAGRFVRCWFIGCVARIYKPGCKMDNMLVLVGDQAHMKSTFFKALAGDQFFTDTAIDFENKDSLMVMRRAWIAEYSEMKALMAARSEEEIKSGITRAVDEFRPPYARATVQVPRHTVFAGTTNNGEFLRDPTGNRRYWPLAVRRRIDIEKVRAWRDQLWAEAVVAYRQGEQWWLDPEEEATLRDHQEDFMRMDCWDALIAAYLGSTKDPVTVMGVLSGPLDMPKERQDPKAESRVKAILERLGQ